VWTFENGGWRVDICLETIGAETPNIYFKPIYQEINYLIDEDAKRLKADPKYIHTIVCNLKYEPGLSGKEKGKACISSEMPMSYQKGKGEFIEIIKKAKKKGINVTCEAAPHHFSLSEEDVLDYDANKKMNPPLREKGDSEAIKQGLRDGTIDAIASDHAPHTENEKDIEFERAEFGVIGLETELAVAITELVDTGILDWTELVRKMSLAPAKILGIEQGTLSVGGRADIVIVNPAAEWVVEKKGIVSKSKNSPFLGRKLKGVVEYTICNGALAYPFV